MFLWCPCQWSALLGSRACIAFCCMFMTFNCSRVPFFADHWRYFSYSSPFSLLSHHFCCQTAFSLLASKCFVVSCYALMACSMWSRGFWLGGSLVSANSAVLLHSHDGMTMWIWCLCSLFCLVLSYQYLNWYNAITSLPCSLNWIVGHFPHCFFWCLFCLVCSSFVLLLCVLFCLLLCFCNGIVTAARLCTASIPVHFGGPPPEGGYLYAVTRSSNLYTVSMQHGTERVERPGKSQEALDRPLAVLSVEDGAVPTCCFDKRLCKCIRLEFVPA